MFTDWKTFHGVKCSLDYVSFFFGNMKLKGIVTRSVSWRNFPYMKINQIIQVIDLSSEI